MVDDGTIVVNDPLSFDIKIDGTQAIVVAEIPENFFNAINSLADGKVLAIVDIKSSVSGTTAEVCHISNNIICAIEL